MDETRALTLLRNQLKGSFGGINSEQDDAIALIEALDYMPLAISQAAAYISQRAPRTSVSAYLQHLLKDDRDKLLHMDLGDTRRDGTPSNSIIQTWQISFEHIRRERPSATRLLSLMSLFNRQEIPQSLISDRYHQSHDDVGTDFEDDLNMLLSFSLVATDMDGRHFQMHRLVQYSTMKWLKLNGDLERFKENYITLIDDNYPESTYENWNACQTLFPHAQAVVACRPTSHNKLEIWASVLSKTMVHAYEMGYYETAEEMGRRALEARQTILQPEDPRTLSSISALAVALRMGGKYEDAELMFRRALQGREKALQRDDPLALSDLNSLALVLSDRGKYEEAELLHRQALLAQENILGLNHQFTLQTIGDLGSLLTKREKYKEAELMHRRALEIEERMFGLNYKCTIASIDNLALALAKQGEFHEAAIMHRRALIASEKRLSERHPDTLICARNLASVLGFLTQFEEAESLHRRVLNDSIEVLGGNHPFTLYSYCNLGSVLHSRGRYQEAEAMHRQALSRREKVLGKEHPHTLSSMHNLAKTLKGLHWDKEAYLLIKTCFELRERVLGTLHPDTRKSLELFKEWANVSHHDTGMVGIDI